MQRFWQSFILCGFAFLIMASPSQAEENDFADVDFYLKEPCSGPTCDLSTEEPSSSKPRNFICVRDPPAQNEYYELGTWERNMGGPFDLGDSYSYVLWVESSNVGEINIRTELFISWIDFSVDPAETRTTIISEDEVTKRGEEGPFGPSILNGNYTVELEESSLDKSGFPNGVPAYTTLGINVETKITFVGDAAEVNHSAYVKFDGVADGTVFDSSLTMNFRHVEIVDDYLGYFSNDRVEEMGADSLFIKVNVTNALGADNLDSESANIEIQGISGVGTFKNSILAKDKHTYAKYIQGTWHYQEDQNIVTGVYKIDFSIKDIYGNVWFANMDYELVKRFFRKFRSFLAPGLQVRKSRISRDKKQF